MNQSPADEALMLRFQQDGDMAAFEELFQRHKDGFAGFLMRLSGSRAIAEDISQDIWLKLIDVARRGRYSAQSSFRSFLYTLGRNRYIDEFVRKHQHSKSQALDGHDIADDASGSDPMAAAGADELSVALDQALRELPFEQREILALWSGGMGTELMAEISGAPRDTVLSRKKYALQKLRKWLAAAGISREVI